MLNPLLQKLASFIDLGIEETAAIEALSQTPTQMKAGRPLIREGDRPENVFLLLEGWAYRYKGLPDGSRQIMAYLIPGDLCDPHVFILKQMDHSIGLLSDALVSVIPKRQILDLTERFPAIARGFWWSSLVDVGVLREWLVNIGQRDAYDRIAHLFYEMWVRMNMVGLAADGEFSLPLTQEQLGDTMGLTSVHVNRVLQKMRADGLITMQSKQLIIHDIDRMRRVAGFDAKYLHLARRA